MRLLIHHLDTNTGSARAAVQLMEGLKIEEVWCGQRNIGFISNYAKDNEYCAIWSINVLNSSNLFAYIKIQAILFTRLLFHANKYDEIWVNSLTPISALLYSIISGRRLKYILWIHEERLTNIFLNKVVKFLLRFYTGKIFYSSNYLSEIYDLPGLVISPYPDSQFILHSKVRNSFNSV